MCGIAGIYNLNGNSVDLNNLKRFTDSMKHRGLDGAGYELFSNNTLGLGHRRLSILDLSEAAKNPLHYADRYVISFNGEIFNFLEIKSELLSKGYSFKTETDTEVVLAAFNEYGKECLLKFNGMWAFAIWDKKENNLFLSRDRFGVKPLHYCFIPNQLFAFASETIAFKYLDGFNRSFDEKNLVCAIQHSNYIEAAGKTIFKSIYQLLPGHSIFISNNKELKIERWWNTADHLVQVNSNYEKQVEEFKELFFSACKLRMRSDVPIASALSGGLDSSSVYCTLQQFKKNSSELQRLPSDWQKAFVATFPGTSMDERHYAEEVINYTNGNAVYIIPDYTNLVKDIVNTTALFDGIIANPVIAISDIYKAMRKNGIIVSLDGHGADEYAFGYNYYVLDAFYEALKNNDEKGATEYSAIVSELSPVYDCGKLMKSFYENNSVKAKIKNKIKAVIKTNGSPKTPAYNLNWFNEESTTETFNTFSNPFNGITKTLFNDFHYNSLPINLRDFDRASMQNSIEIRMPFMDYRLVNYMFSLPQESKLGNGFTKRIIRDAMKGIVPEKIRTRKLKIGIGSPIAEWMVGPMKELVSDTISSKKLLNSNYLKGAEIKKYVEDQYQNNSWNANNASKVWCVVNSQLINE